MVFLALTVGCRLIHGIIVERKDLIATIESSANRGSCRSPNLPVVNQTAIAQLVDAGVIVGIGPQGTSALPQISAWAARNLRFDAGWVSYSVVSV